VARILIVGGGCRGRQFAERMVAEGHAVRTTTRRPGGRAAIEAAGAECWIGTPDRLTTLRGVLDGVTIACWMLAGATGGREEVQALHSTRLEQFLGQAIDTTVRGFVYDASPAGVEPALLAAGERAARAIAALNAIPLAVIAASGGAGAAERWIADASAAVKALLGGA
jgi:nucleoside-diphosphate-sugar epimerase